MALTIASRSTAAACSAAPLRTPAWTAGRSLGSTCRPSLLRPAASAAAHVTVPSVSAPAPIVVNVPEAKPAVLPPAASYANMVGAGTAKALMPAGKIFILGVMAGAYIALGSFLMMAVGGHMGALATANPGLWRLTYALVFPYGLAMVLLGGGELFTGNTLFVASALFEGKIKAGDLAKNWFWSYTGNLVGSLAMVAAVVYSGVMAGNMMPVNAAVAKCSLPLGVAVMRAIFANWLVCIAVKQAAAASTLPGKMLAIWPPVTAFIALGLEHSVANMFVIPLGIALGAKVTMTEFFINNLIPVTIGNAFAGVVLMALTYAICFGEMGKKVFAPTA